MVSYQFNFKVKYYPIIVFMCAMTFKVTKEF